MAATRLGPQPVEQAGQRVSTPSWSRRLGVWLMLPREHGAWAMLLMPYVVGTAAARAGSWASLLLLVSLVALFASSRPLEVALQSGGGPAEVRVRRNQALFRLAAYLSSGGAAGLVLLLGYQLWALVGVGAMAAVVLALVAYMRRHRLDRTRPARMLSIIALSASGPAAYYAATGVLDSHAMAVWLLTCLYSCASLFYVRLFYRPLSRRDPSIPEDGRVWAERVLIAYVGGAISLTLVLSATGWMPPLAALTLLPLGVKSLWGVARRDYQPSLKQIGMWEVGHATIFGVLAATAVALWV